jgi:hypothetical protein
MKYALLAYDPEGSLDELASDDKAALHAAHSTLHKNETDDGATTIAHYRFRPPRLTTTVRLTADGPLRSDGPTSARSETLRALYVLEGDDLDAIVELATRLPALQHAIIIEIRPLTEPPPH